MVFGGRTPLAARMVDTKHVDPTERAVSDITWIAPASIVAIILNSLAGLVAPFVIGRPFFDDAFAATIVFVALPVVAVADFAVVRFLLLPAQFRAYRAPASEAPRPTYEETAAATTVLSYAFPVATAVYGVVIAICAGQALLMLPFAAIALVSHVGIGGYLRESLETLRRDISVGSAAR